MNRRASKAIVFVVLVCGGASFADEDPIRHRLAAAKEEYEKAVEKSRNALLADLKKKQDSAQKSGDLKTLERVQAETKAFEESGELPKSVAVKGYESQVRAARAKLEEKYSAAVKDYTKDGKIALAKTVQQELDEFKKNEATKLDPFKLPSLAAKEWIKRGSGLKLWDVKEGDGKAVASGNTVRIHYTGWLTNGTVFDSTRRKGEPVELTLTDTVIKGWAEGLPGMKVGGIRRLVIPPDLAYGKAGAGKAIPADATLVFEVELLQIKK